MYKLMEFSSCDILHRHSLYNMIMMKTTFQSSCFNRHLFIKLQNRTKLINPHHIFYTTTLYTLFKQDGRKKRQKICIKNKNRSFATHQQEIELCNHNLLASQFSNDHCCLAESPSHCSISSLFLASLMAKHLSLLPCLRSLVVLL